MNLPNKLTVSRLVLTVVFILFIIQEGLWPKVFGAFTFVLASLTDYLDGHLAKKRKLETDFGKIMDPIADKFLMLSAFYVFGVFHVFAAWMFWLIFIREVSITVIRLIAIKKGRVLAAEKMGKIKTVMQVMAVYVVLSFMIFREISKTTGEFSASLHGWQSGIILMMYGVVIMTVVSGISFLRNNRPLF